MYRSILCSSTSLGLSHVRCGPLRIIFLTFVLLLTQTDSRAGIEYTKTNTVISGKKTYAIGTYISTSK